jgi:mono/diheme cytochrome c family protein
MRKWIRRIVRVLAVLLIVVIVVLIGLVLFVQLGWDRSFSREVIEMTAPSDEQTLARGAYLYNEAMFCWGCHGQEGSNGPDGDQVGGIKFDLTEVGPGLGIYYAPNITQDPETGIGNWSDGELVRAIREGVDREDKLIFPVMPYQFAHGLSDEDALSLVAYLRTLEPVKSEVPDNEYSFVVKALVGLRIVKPESAITEKIASPRQGPTAEYGEYLAWHASGCAECHTPRSPDTGAIDWDRIFGGALFSIDEEYVSLAGPNLTPDHKTGIGAWSKDQFISAMRTGLRPDGTVLLPWMPWPRYQQWSEDDLTALWLYLGSLEPVNHVPPESKVIGVAAEGSGAERGEALYEVYCSDCHGNDRQGSVLVSTSLRQSIRQLSDAEIANTISNGPEGTEDMPGFGNTLSEEEISDIIRFFRTR